MARSSALTADAEAYVERVVRQVRAGLARRLARQKSQAAQVQSALPAEALAERMLEVLPQPSPWNQLIGPFYTTSQVRTLLGGIRRQAIDDRRRRRTILVLTTADGTLVYPAFQFGDDNEVLKGFAEILQCFEPDVVDDWTLAGWLISPLKSLGGKSIVDWLRRGKDLQTAKQLARQAAVRFAA
jgi:hypothetical protein